EEAGEEPLWEGETWVWLPHEIYFASSSQTWGGSAVAFICLERTEARPTLGRAFLVGRERFDAVLAVEHLRIPLAWDFDVHDLDVGSWCPLPTKAKYNAVLRLPNIADSPAFAITTARTFEHGQPSDAYLATCREGLAEAPLLDNV